MRVHSIINFIRGNLGFLWVHFVIFYDLFYLGRILQKRRPDSRLSLLVLQTNTALKVALSLSNNNPLFFSVSLSISLIIAFLPLLLLYLGQ